MAIVKTPFKLVEIGSKMLRADMVKGSHNRPLKRRPSIFNAVGMDVPAHPFFLAVIYAFVMVRVVQGIVGAVFIRENIRALGHSLVHDPREDSAARSWNHPRFELSTALQQPADRSFLPRSALASRVTLTPDVGFIDFNRALKFRLSLQFLNCLANSMAQIPRCFVTYLERALHLIRGDSLFGLHHQVDSEEPLPKRQVGVVEDSARSYGELVAA